MRKGYIFTACFFLIFINFFGIYASDNEYFDKGVNHYQKKEFALAAVHLEEAKKIDPGESLIYFYLGNAYYQLNDLDNAIINYTAGLNFTDEKAPFFYNLGNCYFLKENYNFSSEMYSKAVSSDPTLYDSYLNTGTAHYKTGNYAETIFQWETYLEKYPKTPQYEKIEKAIAYLREELNKTANGQTSGENDHDSSDPGIDEKTGLDIDLLSDVMSDLEKLINQTENVMEISEKPIDDLSIEDIER